MDNSLYESLKKYTGSNIYPFHMPGHKRNEEFLNFDISPVAIDVTEVEATDNLQNPTGIILEAEKKAAALFGADRSFIIANGSTGGILAAILACVSEGDVIITARNSHMSVYSGISLSGAQPVYIYPKVSKEGIPGPVAPCDIELALKNNPKAKAVIITNPTYEGILSDVSQIAAIAHKYNAVLIVDEAHGAHFGFHKCLPKSALNCGADIVVQSLHKTLPSLTQTALLHIKGERVNGRRVRQFLNMVNSSSPSYILLSSVDKCLSFLENSGKKFDEYAEILLDFRRKISNLNNFKLMDKAYLEAEFGSDGGFLNFDISKIVIITEQGEKIADILQKDYAIQFEAAAENFMLAMTSVADKAEGFSRLHKALNELDGKSKALNMRTYGNYPKEIKAMPVKAAMFAESEKAEIGKAIGRIAAEKIAPYPPGIPIVLPGEIITKEICQWLGESYSHAEIHIVKEQESGGK